MKVKKNAICKLLYKFAALLLSAAVFTASADITVSAKSYSAEDFVHAKGSKIIGTDGEELHIKGMALGNNVWSNPSVPDYSHHDESTYKELSELGFNSVRFYINYGLFESDDNPYHYKSTGFKWLDKNIRWAKKYGIGIIINMHYPQGKYQSNGEGLELWTNKSYQNRLAALWKSIARRYANEPAVWGYGLINEPVVPMRDTRKQTYGQYNKLMNRIAAGIRSVSPYQAVFVEGICAVIKANGERVYDYFSVEDCFAKIDDKNIVYEFHSYNPFHFTHQNTDWAGTAGIEMTYPSAEVVSEEVINGWVKCESAAKVQKKPDGWTYFKSEAVAVSQEANILQAALNASYLGEDGTAYFDDIILTEVSPKGTRKILFKADFSDGITDSSAWSEDGTGVTEYCADDGNRAAGCLKISGTQGMYIQNFKRFEMKKGYKYIIAGYIKSDSNSPQIRIDMSLSKNVKRFNKAYLESGFKPYLEYSKAHNVPIYLGEFGVISAGFENGHNGIGWVRDMIRICQKYDIGFNYHVYNEVPFGLYDAYPNGRNEALAELFKAELN